MTTKSPRRQTKTTASKTKSKSTKTKAKGKQQTSSEKKTKKNSKTNKKTNQKGPIIEKSRNIQKDCTIQRNRIKNLLKPLKIYMYIRENFTCILVIFDRKNSIFIILMLFL